MQMIRGRRGAALAALCLAAASALAAGIERTPLDRFLDNLTTWQADFAQQLRDGKGRVQSRAEGRMTVSRPGKFRWELRPAGPGPTQYSQLLLADGRNLWFYDRDLAQVTVKPATTALASAPAALLAGGSNWREGFLVRSLPRAADLDWLEVRPRRANAEFRDLRLGFAGADLRRMVVRDNLGQIAEIEFRNAQRNPAVPRELLEFTPPGGVDVIGAPLTGP